MADETPAPEASPVLGCRLDIEALLRDEIPPIPWAVDGLIPEGTAGLITGESYVGKTYYLMDLAIQLSTGGTWLGKYPITRPYRVAYFDKEQPKHEVQRRFARMLRGQRKGFVPPPPKDLQVYTNSVFHMQNGMYDPAFRDWLVGEGIEVVLVDSMRHLVTGDENKSEGPAGWLRTYTELRSARGGNLTFVGIHHWNKESVSQGEVKDTRKEAARVRGSSAWIDVMDFHMSVREDQQKRKHHSLFTATKVRANMPEAGVAVRFVHTDPADTENTPIRLETLDATQVMTHTERYRAIYDIVNAVTNPDDALTVKDVIDRSGQTRSAVRHNLDALSKNEDIVCVPGGKGRGNQALYHAQNKMARENGTENGKMVENGYA